MIDALFWYTGLVVWISIVLAVVSMLVVEAHDRSVLGERGYPTDDHPSLRALGSI